MSIFIGNHDRLPEKDTIVSEDSVYYGLIELEKGYREIVSEQSEGVFASQIYDCDAIALEALNIFAAKTNLYLDSAIKTTLASIGKHIRDISDMNNKLQSYVNSNKSAIRDYGSSINIKSHIFSTDKHLNFDKMYDVVIKMRGDFIEVCDMDFGEHVKMLRDPYGHFDQLTPDAFRGTILFTDKYKKVKIDRKSWDDVLFKTFHSENLEPIEYTLDTEGIIDMLNTIDDYDNRIKTINGERSEVMKSMDVASRFFYDNRDKMDVLPLFNNQSGGAMVARYLRWKTNQILDYSTAAVIALNAKLHAMYEELNTYYIILNGIMNHCDTTGGAYVDFC